MNKIPAGTLQKNSITTPPDELYIPVTLQTTGFYFSEMCIKTDNIHTTDPASSSVMGIDQEFKLLNLAR